MRRFVIMKPFFFFVLVTGSLAHDGLSQVKNFRDDALLLKTTILQNHVNPRQIDDRFSEWMFERFINELDPNHLYFTEEDISTIRPYSFKLDDELNGTSWLFFPEVMQLYRRTLHRAAALIEETLRTPFTFNTKHFYKHDSLWARDENELRGRWHTVLKYETFSRLYEMTYIDEEGQDIDPAKNEAEARQIVKVATARSVQRILNHASGYENHVATLYLQTIALAFDPHSAYLSPTLWKILFLP